MLLHLLVLALFLRTPLLRPGPLPPSLPVLEVDLAPRQDTPPPKQADMLAEANQRAEQTRAPEPILAPPPPSLHEERPAVPPQQKAEPAPAPKPAPRPAHPQDTRAAHQPEQAPKPPHKPAPAAVQAPEAAPSPAPAEPSQATPSLAERSLKMSRLYSDILEQDLRHEVAARSAVLSANTVYGPEAAYLRAWVQKVERIGNLNFPDEARRKRLSGRLILEVKLDDQGRVVAMRVRQSSGEPVLDAAAQDIVRLASPFAPFPSELRMKYDQLTIVRTWVFDAREGLNTR